MKTGKCAGATIVSRYGKLVTGLKELTAGVYDCHNGTSIGLLSTEGGWYYFSPGTAKMYAGGDYTIGGKTYKFNADGLCIG